MVAFILPAHIISCLPHRAPIQFEIDTERCLRHARRQFKSPASLLCIVSLLEYMLIPNTESIHHPLQCMKRSPTPAFFLFDRRRFAYIAFRDRAAPAVFTEIRKLCHHRLTEMFFYGCLRPAELTGIHCICLDGFT